MSYKRRLEKLEKQSIDKTENMYVLWEDDKDTFRQEAFRDPTKDVIYTAKEVKELKANKSNHVLIAKWVGADDV